MDNRSVEFPTISESDLAGKLVSELDDRPQMLPGELKARFDALGREVIIPALNKISRSAESVSEKVDECFQSVSNGKELIASAITDKGISTDATATFEQMASNISDIVAGATPTAGNKDTKIGSHSGYSSSSATPSITLPANGTYIVTFVACQGSSDGYDANSSFSVGNFSVEGTNVIENAIIGKADNAAIAQGGVTRMYSQSILVTTEDSDVTISRKATASGFGGNVIATIYAIKLL